VRNWQNILRQIAVNGIMAAGVTGVFLAGGFDLSIGSTLALSGCLSMGLLQAGVAMPIVVLASLTSGIVIGALNGILLRVTRGDLSETFLITLGTSLIASSAALMYTGGHSIYLERGIPFAFFGQGMIWGVPFSIIMLITIMIILQFIFAKTQYGRRIYLTGGNKQAAYLSGINAARIKISVFMTSGFCAALAGIVSSSRSTTATYLMGVGTDFDAVIAVLIGGNMLGGGKGGMVNTFIGVMIYGLITNVLNLATVPPVIHVTLRGTMLLLAIVLNGLKRN